MKFEAKQIQKLTNAHVLNEALHDMLITQLCYDSRKINHPTSSLFFAFIGKDQDGHQYIADAYQSGVRNFIVTQSISVDEFQKANFYKVENALLALQAVASAYRQSIATKILAITGSNGKTIVKEWNSQLLGSEVYRSPLSYNSQLGVAISVSNIPEQTELAIIEAGISQKGEMSKLQSIIQAQHVLFTNLGSAHDSGFKDQSEKLSEKLSLAKDAQNIYCGSNQREVLDYIKQTFKQKNIITWGHQADDALQIIEQISHTHSTTLKLKHRGNHYDFALPFLDDISIENIMHALNFVLDQFDDFEQLHSRLTKLTPIRLRLEILEGINNCKLINDAYVSDLYALQRAINFQQLHKDDKSLTVIISDIHSSKLSKVALNSEIAKYLNHSDISRVIIVGRSGLEIEKYLRPNIAYVRIDSTSDLSKLSFKDECILIKGSRTSSLESSLEYLEKRAYTSRLEINLAAIDHNYNYYKSKLKSKTGIMAVLKAGAYGTGSLPIAKRLVDKNVDYILVAHIDEGIELRNNGISAPIVVLNPDPYSLYKLFEYNLETELYSQEILEKIDQLSRQYQSEINIHVNLDTGMHRLGLQAAELPLLINTLTRNDYIQIETIFSHLAGSEHPDHDTFSQQQFATFELLSSQIEAALNISPKKHILNSAGILRFEDQQMDLVRLGLGLYGVDSSGIHQEALKKVHTWVAHVLQVKHIKAGATLGYNQTFTAEQDMTIAILNIGYADGLPRSLSNKKWHLKLDGKPVPIVGNISMDLTMIDITAFKNVQVGAAVIIFDEDLKIEDLAHQVGTIPYEILTGISDRVKRIYFTE